MTNQQIITLMCQTLRKASVHPRGGCYLLGKEGQVNIFRLRTQQSRLNEHTQTKLEVGSPSMSCEAASQTAEHILQHCTKYPAQTGDFSRTMKQP